MMWERIRFQNSRGLELAGLLYRGNVKGRIIITCHGFTGSKEGGGQAGNMAQEFGGHGWDTLLFDFAGNGESQGAFEELTLSGQIDDLTRAVDWCLAGGYKEVVTLGRSFGGTTVICQAAGDPRVSAVCTWAAPANLIELFGGYTDEPLEGPADERMTLAGAEGMIELKRNFFHDLSKYDVASRAAAISPRPLLVLHGTSDATVPPGDADIIYNAPGQNRQRIWIQGGDHQFSQHSRQVWDIVIQWLNSLAKQDRSN